MLVTVADRTVKRRLWVVRRVTVIKNVFLKFGEDFGARRRIVLPNRGVRET